MRRSQFLWKQVILVWRRWDLLTPTIHCWFLLLWAIVLCVEPVLSLIGEHHSLISSSHTIVKRSVYRINLLIYRWVSTHTVLLLLTIIILEISCIWNLTCLYIIYVLTASSWVISTFLAYINFIKCWSVQILYQLSSFRIVYLRKRVDKLRLGLLMLCRLLQ